MTIARTYFKGQSEVLDSQYRSSSMKGNNADTGSNREEILSRWLMRHLPNSVSPEIGGQIIDSKGHVTDQIDVVLYNDNTPRFGGNPKSYYFAEGVIAAVQVKSKLTSGTLSLAVENLNSVKKCQLKFSMGFTIGKPSDSILTGIFAYELDDKDFSSVQSVITALKRHESEGKGSVDFVCINQKTYIAYNRGEWKSKDDKGTKNPMQLGYVEPDSSEECIFRMVLTLSSEAKKNIATAVDFQSYFLPGWEENK